jgi:hypothetical protein
MTVDLGRSTSDLLRSHCRQDCRQTVNDIDRIDVDGCLVSLVCCHVSTGAKSFSSGRGQGRPEAVVCHTKRP